MKFFLYGNIYEFRLNCIGFIEHNINGKWKTFILKKICKRCRGQFLKKNRFWSQCLLNPLNRIIGSLENTRRTNTDYNIMGKNQKGIKHVEYLGLLQFQRLNFEIYIKFINLVLFIIFCSIRIFFYRFIQIKEKTVCLVA